MGRPEDYAMLVQHIAENPVQNGDIIRVDAQCGWRRARDAPAAESAAPEASARGSRRRLAAERSRVREQRNLLTGIMALGHYMR